MIKRVGNEIRFNGEKVQIFGRSSFKALAHLRHGNDDGFKDWVGHCQKYGFNLLRVFGETMYWRDHPMFGSPPKLGGIWNGGALQNGNRPTELTNVNKNTIRKMFQYSQETGMAFEYVVDATLKHAEPQDIPWGTIGHCVRQTMSYMRQMQEEFPRALVMVNFHNEWDAHSKGSWNRDGLDYKGALAEVNKQAMRARRWRNGNAVHISYASPGAGWEPEQWPDATILVDHGGRNEIEYAAGPSPHKYDLVTLHPTRHGQWWTLVDDGVFNQYIDGPVPLYFSESKMWVDPGDKDRASEWYPHTGGWTTDWNRYEHWMESAKARGIHFTVHDEKGMQSVSGWPRRETYLEERLGGGSPPPPPPPEEDFIVHKTGKDTRGHFNIKVEFPNQPAQIERGTPYTKKVKVPLGEKCYIYKVDAFNGLDRGDIVEMDTFVYDSTGRALYQRSLHKESHAMYNSYWPIAADAVTSSVDIHMHAHVTAAGDAPDLEKKARAHWNIMLWCAPWKTSPPPIDPTSSDYITMAHAEKEVKWLRANMLIWQGVYDPNYVLGNCRWALGGNPFEMTEAEMRTFATNYHQHYREGETLVRRLREEHPSFPGRSVVKKTTLNEYKEKLNHLNATANWLRDATEGWPGKGTDYDSIKGFCEYCNKHGIYEK